MKDHNSKTANPYEKAPRNWGTATKEAIELARERNAVVYQEHKSVDGNESFGTLTFKGLDGNIYNVRALTGGLGKGSQPGVANGTNARDPRHGNIFIPEYSISKEITGKNLHIRVFPISDPPAATHRGNMPEHRDVPELGKSNGCPNHHPADEKIIRNKLAPMLEKYGSRSYAMLPSLDKNNPYATHFYQSDERLAKAKESATKLAKNEHNHNEVHPTQLARYSPNHTRTP